MKSVGKKDRKDVFVVLKFDKEVLLVQPMQTTLIVADLNLSSIKDSSSLFR